VRQSGWPPFAVLNDRDEPCTGEIGAEVAAHLARELAAARAKRDEARRNYQFMVDRAANEKPTLDGYRDLGQRAANAEAEIDRLRGRVAELEAALASERSRQTESFATADAAAEGYVLRLRDMEPSRQGRPSTLIYRRLDFVAGYQAGAAAAEARVAAAEQLAHQLTNDYAEAAHDLHAKREAAEAALAEAKRRADEYENRMHRAECYAKSAGEQRDEYQSLYAEAKRREGYRLDEFDLDGAIAFAREVECIGFGDEINEWARQVQRNLRLLAGDGEKGGG
jgi:hypothetical protein